MNPKRDRASAKRIRIPSGCVIAAMHIASISIACDNEGRELQHPNAATAVAVSLTELDFSADLNFLSSERNRYQITITDEYGYGEHLVVGYFQRPEEARASPVAFFQSWDYDPETKETRAVRSVIMPRRDWESAFEHLEGSSFDQLFAKSERRTLIRGDGTVRVCAAENSDSHTTYSRRFSELDFEHGIESWLKEFEEIFPITWSFIPKPFSPPPVLLSPEPE